TESTAEARWVREIIVWLISHAPFWLPLSRKFTYLDDDNIGRHSSQGWSKLLPQSRAGTMNRPSRTDEPYEGEGYNQSPSPLSNDLTTNEDLNGTVNARELEPARDSKEALAGAGDVAITRADDSWEKDGVGLAAGDLSAKSAGLGQPEGEGALAAAPLPTLHSQHPSNGGDEGSVRKGILVRARSAVVKFGSFIGPGFMISVAYIDPGNYATGVAAGATYRFRLLFVVLLANLFAIFLQSLCTKLGTVTGLNLAEACRAFLPRWMNYVLYAFAEVAIIATDIAE
ncbi:Manganese transporter SMF1, partial [Colletotrichum tanaceti]